MKTVALIIAHQGYQQTEYNIPKEILTRSNIKVLTVSDEAGTAIAKDSSTADINITTDSLKPNEIDGVFLIGGPGALECLDNTIVHSILDQMASLEKPLGAICISPRILAKANVLGGKNATGWNGDNKLEQIFNKYGVNYIKKPVVIDKNIVTAVGPDAAEDFAHSILSII